MCNCNLTSLEVTCNVRKARKFKSHYIDSVLKLYYTSTVTNYPMCWVLVNPQTFLIKWHLIKHNANGASDHWSFMNKAKSLCCVHVWECRCKRSALITFYILFRIYIHVLKYLSTQILPTLVLVITCCFSVLFFFIFYLKMKNEKKNGEVTKIFVMFYLLMLFFILLFLLYFLFYVAFLFYLSFSIFLIIS